MNKKTMLLDGIQQLPENDGATGILWAFASGLLDLSREDSQEAAIRRGIIEMIQGLDLKALQRVSALTQYLFLRKQEDKTK